MKKIIYVLMIFALLITATGCSDDEIKGENEVICELLDLLTQKEYSVIEISIKTSTDPAQLRSHYKVTQGSVAYSIEQLNLLPSLENVAELSPDQKKTISGTAIIENGEVIELDGNSVTLPSGDELMGKFSFDEKNLQNIVVENGTLTADVILPSAFYGVEVDMTNVKIAVKYSESAIEMITVSYKTEKSAVEAVYKFEC